jgi:hypothetical protein
MRQLLTFLTILFAVTSCSGQTDNKENEVIIEFRNHKTICRTEKIFKENYNWRQGQLTVEGTVYVDFVVLEDGSLLMQKFSKDFAQLVTQRH